MDKAFPESEYIEINDISVHYRVWTPETAFIKGKVLLVHGLGGSTFSWRNNIAPLQKEGYLVVAADLPGFGYSDRKSGIDHSQRARSDILWQLLDQIDPTLDQDAASSGWVLAGHSMGAGTVSAMAINKPERVSGLVFVDGAVLTENPKISAALIQYPPLARWIQVLFSHYVSDRDRIGNFLASAYGREPSHDEITGYHDPLLIPGTANSLIDMTRTAQNEPVEQLQDLDIPIFAIWGDLDTWVPIEDADKLKAILPALELHTINGAAHCPMETHYEEFNRELLGFMEKISN